MEKVITIIVVVALLILIPILMRKWSWHRIVKALREEDFEKYYRSIDSLMCKLSYSAFDRENMRLSGYMTQNRREDIEEQFTMMKKMRVKDKSKIALGSRGFYYYLEQGRVKKARDMIDFVRLNGGDAACHDLEIQYSILLKKESKYIDEIKAKLNALWDGTSSLPEDRKIIVGTFEYLIGLQYSYLKDKENMMKYFKPALEHCANTPYEENIRQIIAQM